MAKQFDATLKALVDRNPKDWLTLAGFPDTDAEVIDADVSTVTAATDKVLRVKGPSPWLLDLNFQSGPDATLPRRVHGYNALLENQHDLLVRSVVLLLAREAQLATITGRYLRGFPGEEPYLDFRYRLIRVWELPVETLLQSGLGTLPLAPLSAVDQDQLPQVIHKMRERVASEPVESAQNMWAATFVLMGLRLEKEIARKLLRGVLTMKESTTYQAIVQEGKEIGLQEGLAEGISQGLAKGELLRARRTLIMQGTEKFGSPSPGIKQEIESIDDLHRLDELSLRLLKVKSWQELLHNSKGATRRRKK